MSSAIRDFNRLVDAAIAQGWRAQPARNRTKLLSPDGVHIVVMPAAPAAHKRGLQNKTAELRRAGLHV
jgi:hypothetical protein